MSDQYELSCCLLGPPNLATKFGYELRLLGDDTGFAYRGPLLSAAVERSKFWTQVRRREEGVPLYYTLNYRDIICIFRTWRSWAATARLQSRFFTKIKKSWTGPDYKITGSGVS